MEIKQLLSEMDYCLMHVFRESNKGADFMANWGCTQQKFYVFEISADMPKILRGLCRLR